MLSTCAWHCGGSAEALPFTSFYPAGSWYHCQRGLMVVVSEWKPTRRGAESSEGNAPRKAKLFTSLVKS